jgi:hypothetical protein
MVAPGPRLAIFVFALGCASTRLAINYRLENNLEACVKIDRQTSSWSGALPVLELRYHMAKSTAECGCKSALSTYSSFAQSSAGERYMSGGTMTLAGSDEVTLPLSVDRDLLGEAPVRVSLGCERPE